MEYYFSKNATHCRTVCYLDIDTQPVINFLIIAVCLKEEVHDLMILFKIIMLVIVFR